MYVRHSHVNFIRKLSCKLCQSVQTVCSNFMKTSYTCRKFLHFGKCSKIFIKLAPHCLISTRILKEAFLFLYMRTCNLDINSFILHPTRHSIPLLITCCSTCSFCIAFIYTCTCMYVHFEGPTFSKFISTKFLAVWN